MNCIVDKMITMFAKKLQRGNVEWALKIVSNSKQSMYVFV